MAESTSRSADPVVVRFAPSPTGYLHIGGARTALFNWLYAKARGGRFLLRIEDTDRARNSDAAVTAILDGLSWLGLDWDGEVVSQYSRAARHREVAEAMLASGHAYRCYLSKAQLDDMRVHAEASKSPLTIRSPWRDRDPSEAPAGVPPAIRLKAPREGETIVEDKVRGRVTFANKDLDDLVILRSDGSPTYNLAVVVDDHDMGVTHVIRGEDHLTNAGRQSQIYAANGWTIPVWAHVPLIHGPDGAKMSKRHGALGVEAYRAMGYLPAALRNYLVRLGWSHGDDEIIGTAELIAWFDLDGLGKSPARFDSRKLDDLNAHYIRQATPAALMADIKAVLPLLDFAALRAPAEPQSAPRGDVELARSVARELRGVETGEALAARFAGLGWEKLESALTGLRERARTIPEIADGALFLVAQRPIALDDKARKLLDEPGRATIKSLLALLAGLPSWEAGAIEAAVRAHAGASGAKLGKLAQPLRACLTGRAVSPPVFDVMAVLGREEAMARLRDQASV